MKTSLKIASAQYPIGYFASFSEYSIHATNWVNKALYQKADVLLWPEYAAMELASLLPKEIQQDLQKQLNELQIYLDDFKNLYTQLARKHKVYIQPGTFPVQIDEHTFKNRAFLFGPDGAIGFQDKIQMTRFENEEWKISAGNELKVFETNFGKLAISICYDIEFPLIVRHQVEKGATLILVPSCTDTLAGYHRVKIGCQARALENQCFVAQAVTIGDAEWSPAVDKNFGSAAIYCPPDIGLPDNGIVTIGPERQAGWVVADIDLNSIASVRESGQVFNYNDWSKQNIL